MSMELISVFQTLMPRSPTHIAMESHLFMFPRSATISRIRMQPFLEFKTMPFIPSQSHLEFVVALQNAPTFLLVFIATG